jgi:hypothetical protein
MEQSRLIADPAPALAAVSRPAAGARPALAAAQARLDIAAPAEPAPAAWAQGLAALLGWLRIDAVTVPAPMPAPSSIAAALRLPRLARREAGRDSHAPLFAPWLGWGPAAFQHGGLPGLPCADFAVSYALDHPRGAARGRHVGLDLMLISPHPARCSALAPGDVPGPDAGLLLAMIAAARAEGRTRIALVCHARQRNALACALLAAQHRLVREGLALDILAIEDVLVPLIDGAMPWDAIIAMPDLRGTVFTVITRTTGVPGPWPMLWHGRAGVAAITSEAPGEGLSRLPLDAPALIGALALALRGAGMVAAGQRLHEGWARLRDSGVTTAGRGTDAPYVAAVEDVAFIARLCAEQAASRRPQAPWRALGQAKNATSGSQTPRLCVVSSNPANSR